MLKRIHFARPTINYQSQQKHAEKADQLKKRIQNSGSRYAMVQAAREVILKAESSHDGRQTLYSTKNKHGKPNVFPNGVRVSSTSAQRRSFKVSGSRKEIPKQPGANKLQQYQASYGAGLGGQGQQLTNAMKSFHMQNRLKRGHSGSKRPLPPYRGGQRESSNQISNATQPLGLNKRYDESASANEFPGTFLNSTDGMDTSAPALNFSAEALPSTAPPMAPEALGDQQPVQSQKVMNTTQNIEVNQEQR